MIVSAIFSRNTTFYKPYLMLPIGKYIFLLVFKNASVLRISVIRK